MDSENVSVTIMSLVVEKSSVSSVSISELESNTIIEWLSVVSSTNLIEVPSLVDTIVAFPVDNVVVVMVSSSISIKAESTVVSDVRRSSIVPSDSIVVSSSVLSGINSNIGSECSTDLVTDTIVSLVVGSDGLSSQVEGPPLFSVGWIVVLDSDSVLMSSDVFMVEHSSVSVHS